MTILAFIISLFISMIATAIGVSILVWQSEKRIRNQINEMMDESLRYKTTMTDIMMNPETYKGKK